MANFVLIPINNKQTLDGIIKERFGNDSYRLPNGEWLVNYDGTSKQLSDEIGITDGKIGSTIVLNISGYWGRANRDIWEWLRIKTEKND